MRRICDIEMLLLAGLHSLTVPAWMVPALLIILLPSQHQPLSPCPPSLAGQSLLLWVKSLSKEAKRIVCPACPVSPQLFPLMEGQGSGSMLGEVQN